MEKRQSSHWKGLRLGKIQWFLRFHGPPTPDGLGPCDFGPLRTILSCWINYQKFGEFMFGEIITQKLVFTSIFSSVLFRHIRSRQTFATWFHILGHPSIKTAQSLTGRDYIETHIIIDEFFLWKIAYCFYERLQDSFIETIRILSPRKIAKSFKYKEQVVLS